MQTDMDSDGIDSPFRKAVSYTGAFLGVDYSISIYSIVYF